MFSAYIYSTSVDKIIQYNVKTIKISCVLSILLYNHVFDTEINFFLAYKPLVCYNSKGLNTIKHVCG